MCVTLMRVLTSIAISTNLQDGNASWQTIQFARKCSSVTQGEPEMHEPDEEEDEEGRTRRTNARRRIIY